MQIGEMIGNLPNKECEGARGDILRSRLGGGNEIEWKGIKKIILEYSSLPLFGSFNGGNGKFIRLFESLSGRE